MIMSLGNMILAMGFWLLVSQYLTIVYHLIYFKIKFKRTADNSNLEIHFNWVCIIPYWDLFKHGVPNQKGYWRVNAK